MGEALYYDTTCYIGWLPLAAAAALLVRCVVVRRLPKGPWLFVAVLGVLALVLAFPRPWAGGDGGWTILRSPARQIYLTVFALALAAGAGTDWLLRLREPNARGRALLMGSTLALMAVHAFDLRTHVSEFISTFDRPSDQGMPSALVDAVGDGRMAMDTDLINANNRRLDDVGVFDSILLARPYRAILALSDKPPETNVQFINGAELPARALAWAGVRVVVTTEKDLRLPPLETGGALSVYSVPNPLPRAGFVPRSGVRFMDDEAIVAELRSGATPRADQMFLRPQPDAPAPPTTSPATAPAATVTYRRPSPDRIEVDVTAPQEGYVRVLETPDAGWTATLDGRPVELLVADGFVSAVRVPAGTHQVRMAYATPGVGLGAALSAVAAAALAVVVALAPRLARGAPAA
jgi:hypothetical protein